MPQSLSGRTILTTGAYRQKDGLIHELERLGARVIASPMIEITEPADFELLDEALENLYGYDWLIFTSANGVAAFIKRFHSKGHEVSELDDLSICAIGNTTEGALAAASIHVDLVPSRQSAEGVLEALERFLGREKLRGLNFLLPRAAVARDFLPIELERAGARIDCVPVYRTVAATNVDRRKIQAMLKGGAVDCITFSSGSAVRNFAALFDTSNLREHLDDVAVACIGGVTASAVKDFGLNCDIIPEESAAIALASAIASYFSKGANGPDSE